MEASLTSKTVAPHKGEGDPTSGIAELANPELHSTNVTAALAASRDAPLSAKKAMLAALLVDAEADRLFAASGETDILDFRARLAVKSDALALVFALCALRDGGPHLVTEAVQVPIADYPALSVQDFMVSLYNDHSVQRVRIAVGDARHDVHEVLAAALAALQRKAPRSL